MNSAADIKAGRVTVADIRARLEKQLAETKPVWLGPQSPTPKERQAMLRCYESKKIQALLEAKIDLFLLAVENGLEFPGSDV